jgi:hypothetical protein
MIRHWEFLFSGKKYKQSITPPQVDRVRKSFYCPNRRVISLLQAAGNVPLLDSKQSLYKKLR